MKRMICALEKLRIIQSPDIRKIDVFSVRSREVYGLSKVVEQPNTDVFGGEIFFGVPEKESQVLCGVFSV